MKLVEQIENAVRSRQKKQARLLIRSLLKESRNSPEARLQAARFLRRLSEFHAALLILRAPVSADPRAGAGSELRALYDLEFARLLNTLGGSGYAIQVLTRLRREDLQGNADVVLEIFNSNYRYDLALPIAEKALEPLSESSSYLVRLRAVTIADTLMGAGKSQEALGLLDEVLGYSKEPLLLGIAHQAKGAHLILMDRLREGTRQLEESGKWFPESDTTFDRAFLEKWIGAAQALKGETDSAREHLARAMRILARPGFKPESWLEVVYWQGFLKLKKGRRGKLPNEWERLIAYPAPSRHRLIAQIMRYAEVPEEIRFGGTDGGRLRISLVDNTFELRGRPGWNLSYPQRAVGLLTIAGSSGVPLYRLCDALWPDELIAVQTNVRRIEQILMRIRSELRLPLKWEHRHAWLEDSLRASVTWSATAKPDGWGFLSSREEFARAELGTYFRISDRLAQLICQRWIEEGIVQKAPGAGPRTRYLTRT